MSLVAIDRYTGESEGFADVASYEKSHHWARTRALYALSGLPHECVICGHRRYQLHHLHYRTVGREDIERDLMPLCGDHHYEVEKHVRKAKLDGLSRETATHRYIEWFDARRRGQLRPIGAALGGFLRTLGLPRSAGELVAGNDNQRRAG